MIQQSQIIQKKITIGGNVFRLRDPADGAGIELESFRLYQTYELEQSKAESICQKLYQRVVDKVKVGSLGDAKLRLIKYVEELSKSSSCGRSYTDERTYIVITHDTFRNTRATIFMRFHSYGDNLYLGIDAYVLGRVWWKTFISKIFITQILLFIFLPLIGFLTLVSQVIASSVSFLYWLALLAFLVFFWWDLIRRIVQNGSNWRFALRQAFQRDLNIGTFNVDDVMMFLKSTLYIAVTAVRNVFEEENLPLESLDAFVKSINNININTGGGVLNMSGSNIGMGNTANSNDNSVKNSTPK